MSWKLRSTACPPALGLGQYSSGPCPPSKDSARGGGRGTATKAKPSHSETIAKLASSSPAI